MSAATDNPERLVLVRKAIDQLWPPRDDGHWAKLEQTLIDIFEAKQKKTRTRPGRWDYDAGGHWIEAGATCEVCALSDEALIQASRSLRASRSQAPPTPADNVIILSRARATRMRRKA
jgi:hypothetical protein